MVRGTFTKKKGYFRRHRSQFAGKLPCIELPCFPGLSIDTLLKIQIIFICLFVFFIPDLKPISY